MKPAPYCEGKITLDIAKESFVEVANDLPGVQDYNELIKFYQKKEWAKFKTAIIQYKKIYETSQLMEAVQFLEVIATFEQIDRTDYSDSALVEQMFKQAVLLYPKSEFVPLLYASVASLWMKDGLVQKALGYFEKIRKDYPFHPLMCFFQLGSGEASYLMHDYTTSKRTLTQLKQKCTERKYTVGAQTRLNDIELKVHGESYLGEYEKIFYSDINMVNRFFPFVLYNLGEIKFNQKEYKSSKFYFNEFAKYGGRDSVCGPMAQKRLADIAMLTSADIRTVEARYLSVQDQAPLTDIGRYSFVHAMLLEFPDVGEIEQARRIKVIDFEIEKIVDYELRSLAFLEKGLALLSSGREEALNYLLNLSGKTSYNLKTGDLAEFVREEVVAFLEKDASKRESKSKKVDTLTDGDVFTPYENVYETWLKGTSYETRSKLFYEKIILSRYEKALKKKDGLAAVAKLARWKKTSLWNLKGLTNANKRKIGDSLARYMKSLSDEEIQDLSEKLKKFRAEMEVFLNPEYHMLLVALDLPNTSKDEIKSHYEVMRKTRGLAAMPSSLSKDVLSYFYRVKAKMLFAIEKYAAAEEFFLKAHEDKEQKVTVEKEMIHLYEKNKQYKKLLKYSLNVFDSKPSMENLSYLETARIAVGLGKLWADSNSLLTRAQKIELNSNEIIPYKLLLARGSYEIGKCSSAIEHYEALLKEELPAEDAAGSKFRFAKCLLKAKQTPKAIKLFEEVIASNDSFWSPLASSEKNLAEIK